MLTLKQVNETKDQIAFIGEILVNFNGKNLLCEYKRLSLSDNPFLIPVCVCCGYLSGALGGVPLWTEIAAKGYEVYLISLPGYGESENPSSDFYTEDYLYNASEIYYQAMQNLGIKKSHLVGHSMGAAILGRIVANHPEIARTFVALSSSGIRSYNLFQGINLAYRFVKSGMDYNNEYGKNLNDVYKILLECTKQKSPIKGRILQRLFEFIAICQDDNFAGILSRIKCPIINIFGTEDTVFPYEELKIFFDKHGKDVTDIPVLGGMHNTTLYPPHTERVAELLSEVMK